MTDTKFTPGPDYWAELHDVISDAISDSMDMDWTSGMGATSVVAALKNEPMIAAAPDLYEACDPDFLYAVATVLENNNLTSTARMVRKYAADQQKALSRARGES